MHQALDELLYHQYGSPQGAKTGFRMGIRRLEMAFSTKASVVPAVSSPTPLWEYTTKHCINLFLTVNVLTTPEDLVPKNLGGCPIEILTSDLSQSDECNAILTSAWKKLDSDEPKFRDVMRKVCTLVCPPPVARLMVAQDHTLNFWGDNSESARARCVKIALELSFTGWSDASGKVFKDVRAETQTRTAQGIHPRLKIPQSELEFVTSVMLGYIQVECVAQHTVLGVLLYSGTDTESRFPRHQGTPEQQSKDAQREASTSPLIPWDSNNLEFCVHRIFRRLEQKRFEELRPNLFNLLRQVNFVIAPVLLGRANGTTQVMMSDVQHLALTTYPLHFPSWPVGVRPCDPSLKETVPERLKDDFRSLLGALSTQRPVRALLIGLMTALRQGHLFVPKKTDDACLLQATLSPVLAPSASLSSDEDATVERSIINRLTLWKRGQTGSQSSGAHHPDPMLPRSGCVPFCDSYSTLLLERGTAEGNPLGEMYQANFNVQTFKRLWIAELRETANRLQDRANWDASWFEFDSNIWGGQINILQLALLVEDNTPHAALSLRSAAEDFTLEGNDGCSGVRTLTGGIEGSSAGTPAHATSSASMPGADSPLRTHTTRVLPNAGGEGSSARTLTEDMGGSIARTHAHATSSAPTPAATTTHSANQGGPRSIAKKPPPPPDKQPPIGQQPQPTTKSVQTSAVCLPFVRACIKAHKDAPDKSSSKFVCDLQASQTRMHLRKQDLRSLDLLNNTSPAVTVVGLAAMTHAIRHVGSEICCRQTAPNMLPLGFLETITGDLLKAQACLERLQDLQMLGLSVETCTLFVDKEYLLWDYTPDTNGTRMRALPSRKQAREQNMQLDGPAPPPVENMLDTDGPEDLSWCHDNTWQKHLRNFVIMAHRVDKTRMVILQREGVHFQIGRSNKSKADKTRYDAALNGLFTTPIHLLKTESAQELMLAEVTNDKESVCEFVRIDPKYVKPSDVLQEFESANDRIDFCFHELLPKHWKDQPYKSQTWVLPITPGTLGTGRYGCVHIRHPEPTSQKPWPPYRVVYFGPQVPFTREDGVDFQGPQESFTFPYEYMDERNEESVAGASRGKASKKNIPTRIGSQARREHPNKGARIIITTAPRADKHAGVSMPCPTNVALLLRLFCQQLHMFQQKHPTRVILQRHWQGVQTTHNHSLQELSKLPAGDDQRARVAALFALKAPQFTVIRDFLYYCDFGLLVDPLNLLKANEQPASYVNATTSSIDSKQDSWLLLLHHFVAILTTSFSIGPIICYMDEKPWLKRIVESVVWLHDYKDRENGKFANILQNYILSGAFKESSTVYTSPGLYVPVDITAVCTPDFFRDVGCAICPRCGDEVNKLTTIDTVNVEGAAMGPAVLLGVQSVCVSCREGLLCECDGSSTCQHCAGNQAPTFGNDPAAFGDCAFELLSGSLVTCQDHTMAGVFRHLLLGEPEVGPGMMAAGGMRTVALPLGRPQKDAMLDVTPDVLALFCVRDNGSGMLRVLLALYLARGNVDRQRVWQKLNRERACLEPQDNMPETFKEFLQVLTVPYRLCQPGEHAFNINETLLHAMTLMLQSVLDSRFTEERRLLVTIQLITRPHSIDCDACQQALHSVGDANGSVFGCGCLRGATICEENIQLLMPHLSVGAVIADLQGLKLTEDAVKLSAIFVVLLFEDARIHYQGVEWQSPGDGNNRHEWRLVGSSPWKKLPAWLQSFLEIRNAFDYVHDSGIMLQSPSIEEHITALSQLMCSHEYIRVRTFSLDSSCSFTSVQSTSVRVFNSFVMAPLLCLGVLPGHIDSSLGYVSSMESPEGTHMSDEDGKLRSAPSIVQYFTRLVQQELRNVLDLLGAVPASKASSTGCTTSWRDTDKSKNGGNLIEAVLRYCKLDSNVNSPVASAGAAEPAQQSLGQEYPEVWWSVWAYVTCTEVLVLHDLPGDWDAEPSSDIPFTRYIPLDKESRRQQVGHGWRWIRWKRDMGPLNQHAELKIPILIQALKAHGDSAGICVIEKGQGAEMCCVPFLSFVTVGRCKWIPAEPVPRTVAEMLAKVEKRMDDPSQYDILDVNDLICKCLLPPVVISVVGLQLSGVKALLTPRILREFGDPTAEAGTSAARWQELLVKANIPVDAKSLSIFVDSVKTAHTSQHNVGNATANGCVMVEEVGDLDQQGARFVAGLLHTAATALVPEPSA